MATQNALERVTEAFAWFSRVGRREIALDRREMSQYFSPDVRMSVNNIVKAQGFDGLYDRFVEMLQVTQRFEAGPIAPSVVEPGRAASYARFEFVARDGRKGAVQGVSIWTVKDRLITEIFEVVAFDGAPIDLADHGAGAGGRVVT